MPEPGRLQTFFHGHPASVVFRSWVSSYRPGDSFADTRFISINAFVLVVSADTVQRLRAGVRG